MSDTATISKPRPANKRARRQSDDDHNTAGSSDNPIVDPVKVNPAKLVMQVKAMMVEITGLKAETVSRFKVTEDGYEIDIDMVEMKTLQGSSDILATYQVLLDQAGDLIDYRRARRYSRNELGED